MAILDTDTTNGWIREACPPVVVCPGTAGYALDGNDMLHLGRIVQSANGSMYSPNNATGTMSNWGYSSGIAVTGYTTGGVFNKGFVYAYRNNTSGNTIEVTGLSGTDNWTMRGWIEVRYEDQRQNSYFNATNILTTAYPSLHIGFYYGQLQLIENNSSNIGSALFTSANIGLGFKYITITKQGRVLSFYVNGSYIGSYTLPTQTTSAIVLKPIAALTIPSQFHRFMDICVSNVVRNGLFVPTGILGF